MEINGFEIENYNIHGIKDGAKTSVCPVCSADRKKKTDKCLSVFWDTGIAQCNHCGERIQLHTYKKKQEIKVYNRPPTPVKNDFKVGLIDSYIKYYIDYRSLHLKTLEAVKIGFSKRWMPKAKTEIPVIEYRYYLHGELLNIKYRGKGKDFTFEKNCEIFPYGMDDIIGEKWCVVVEGEEDKHSYYQAGIKNCVSVPNGFTLPREDGTSTINTNYLDNVYHVFESMERIYLAVDNDEAGKHGEQELIRRFGAEKVYLVDFKDVKDANDYLKKYKEEALFKTIDDAIRVPLEGIKTLYDIEDELNDFWRNGAPKGYTVGLKELDDCASFSFKQYTLIVSAPNAGKSDLIDQFTTSFAIKYGYKSGICSTENKPLKFHYDKIFRKIHGNRPSSFNINTKDVKECKQFINEHFFHIDKMGRYWLQDILSKFAELVHRKGCRWFIIDPFNKVRLKDFPTTNINEYTAEYHNLIDEFVTKYDAHVFLVLHPTKLQLKEGSTKTFAMPNAYSIKGGGEHFDMAYNIIGMVRDHDKGVVHLRTLKWKFQHEGTQGIDMYYGWNINNGRYTSPPEGFDIDNNYELDFNWDNKSWINPDTAEVNEIAETMPTVDPKDAFDVDDDILNDLPF